jgi:predicted LPLAT superfamily acyltransferase
MNPDVHSADEQSWQKRPEAGGRLGLWLLTSLPFRVGRPVARLITYPVAWYFLLRRAPERAASRAFLTRALGREPTWRDVFRHFLTFSQVTLDRLYLMAESFKRFHVETHGLQALDDAMDLGKGTLVLSAHVGSFDALRVLSERSPDAIIRILLDVGQNAGLSTLLNALNPKLAGMIVDARRSGPELVLKMQEELAKNAVVSTLADRLRPGNPSITANFLGSRAQFPASPWVLAAALRVPVILAFGLYAGGRRYDLYFERFELALPADRKRRPAALAEVVQRFADRLAHYVRKAPYNWFNLYDFWMVENRPDDAGAGHGSGFGADPR